MNGVEGLVTAIKTLAITIVICIAVGLYTLFSSEANWKLIYASLSALVTILLFFITVYADEKHWIDIPNAYYDTLGPVLSVMAVLVAITVYIVV